MKNQKIGIFFTLAYIAVLSACFSPWDGNQGNISLKLGDSENSTMEYTIILTSPGQKSIERGPTTDTIIGISAPQGTWDVEVRAELITDDKYSESFPANLRALGDTTVEIKAGGEVAVVPVKMEAAVQVENWKQILTALGEADFNGKPLRHIEITGDIQANDTTVTLSGNKNITLRANKNVTITRGNETGALFDVKTENTLTLGGVGRGTITIAGNDKTVSHSLITVSGTLIMNEGVTITKNQTSSHGGGVHVNGGTFTMNGGTISSNVSKPTSSTGNAGGGGGVYVDNGKFTMNGGSIFGNKTDGHGGGVRVYKDGKFLMNDGKIYDNESYGFGGGVRVRGEFTMRGGEIYDNKVLKKSDSNNPGHGGGVGVADTATDPIKDPSSGSFTMEGGTIRNNTAASSGGGVFTGPQGTFDKKGGTISGNTPDDTYPKQ